MDFRLAEIQDLPEIKHTFEQIVKRMQDNQLQIWDDIYPCAFFEDDIRNNRLYVLSESTKMISAFALCSADEGEAAITWKDSRGKAFYLDRFGVNINYSRKGIGSLMLEKAKETAKALGADWLRLFVVDENLPAIRFYEKGGFAQAQGIYNMVLDEECTLREYGYEIKL
ncbi:MAG: GNAT family N-acetyltransferase [Lachnospiraceae bacterium]|nr:GNAT family N-acetyltransferase [Lachnospiraceae bacterium]